MEWIQMKGIYWYFGEAGVGKCSDVWLWSILLTGVCLHKPVSNKSFVKVNDWTRLYLWISFPLISSSCHRDFGLLHRGFVSSYRLHTHTHTPTHTHALPPELTAWNRCERRACRAIWIADEREARPPLWEAGLRGLPEPDWPGKGAHCAQKAFSRNHFIPFGSSQFPCKLRHGKFRFCCQVWSHDTVLKEGPNTASGEEPLWHNDDFELKAPVKQQVREGLPAPAFSHSQAPASPWEMGLPSLHHEEKDILATRNGCGGSHRRGQTIFWNNPDPPWVPP